MLNEQQDNPLQASPIATAVQLQQKEGFQYHQLFHQSR